MYLAAEHFVRAPQWEWYILGYFFFAGLTGGAYALATLLRLVGEPRFQRRRRHPRSVRRLLHWRLARRQHPADLERHVVAGRAFSCLGTQRFGRADRPSHKIPPRRRVQPRPPPPGGRVLLDPGA